jgi:hypothetical protein
MMGELTIAERIERCRAELTRQEAIEQAATKGPWWFDFEWLGDEGPFPGVEASNYPGHFVCSRRIAPQKATEDTQDTSIDNMELITLSRNLFPVHLALARKFLAGASALVANGYPARCVPSELACAERLLFGEGA